MFRRFAALCAAVLMLFGAPLSTLAQNATPAAGTAIGPAVGTTVSWIGNEGTEVGKVTVKDLTDPFEGYDPSGPPQRGFHYVLLTVSIENPGSRPLSIDPSTIYIVDQEGYVARGTSVYRPSDATTAQPDLQYGDVAPGDTTTGVVGFLVLNGTTVERVVFSPDSSRLITLVDDRTAITPGGSTVSIIGPDGTETAKIAVNQVLDPFSDYDQSAPPQRGQHYVVLDVEITNTSSRPLTFDPSSLLLVDSDGFAAQRASIYRTDNTNPPDLAYVEMKPGDTTSGYVGFSVLDGTKLTSVLFTNYYSNQQFVILAEAENGKFAQGKVRPAVQPTAEVSAVASSADCQAIGAWFQQGLTRLFSMSNLLTPLTQQLVSENPVLDSANIRSIADQVNAIGDQQESADTPESAKALNKVLVDAVRNVASTLKELADAVDAKDNVAIKAATDKIDAAFGVFDSGGAADVEIQPLVAKCPELKTLLGG